MDCFSCANPAINACKRCAHPYCEDHGNEHYCAECLRPASALPSFNLYRGALLAMLIGTALAVILLLRPPVETRGAPVIVGQSTPTPAGGAGDATVAAETPRATSTPSTPSPTATATVSPFREYTIQEGDTLYGIAGATISPTDDIDAYARAIAALNNLDFDAPVLRAGDVIALPPLPTPAPSP